MFHSIGKLECNIMGCSLHNMDSLHVQQHVLCTCHWLDPCLHCGDHSHASGGYPSRAQKFGNVQWFLPGVAKAHNKGKKGLPCSGLQFRTSFLLAEESRSYVPWQVWSIIQPAAREADVFLTKHR